jgi:hypothetical protein
MTSIGKRRIAGCIPILAFVLIPAVILHSGEQGESKSGKITFLEGSARKHFTGSEGWISIDTLSTLNGVDSVTTLEDSKLEFELSGNGLFRIGPLSTTGIVTGNFDKPDFVSGSMWADFTSMENESTLRCYLPYLTVYSKNAKCRFVCGTDCSTEIRVYSGSLKLYWRQVPDSEDTSRALRHYPCGQDSLNIIRDFTLVIGENRKVILSSKGDIVFQGSFSPSDPDEQTEWVRWNLNREK